MTERWLRELRKLRQMEPPQGLWERALRLAANGAVRSASPRNAGSRRMWSAIAAAAAIALVAGAAIWVRGAAGTGEPLMSRHGGSYTDPNFGWTIRYPGGLLVQPFTGGVRITNFTPDLGQGTGREPEMGWLRSFPATGVAAQIWYPGGLAAATPVHASKFPLRASSFQRTRPNVGGAEPAPAYRSFSADLFSFHAAVWSGPDASTAEKRAIWSVITSLRFPPLRQGMSIYGLVYVLGPASHYPRGSVTVVPAASLSATARQTFGPGFYLVHASRGFYAINQLFISPNRPKVTCMVAFDRATASFYCPGTRLRWNIAGQRLHPPVPVGPYAHNLFQNVAGVSTDGHVLISPRSAPVHYCAEGRQAVPRHRGRCPSS